MHAIELLAVVLAFGAIVQGDDSDCLNNQGTCQKDHLHCDGDYVSGKCSGGVTRRCCLPSGDDSDCLTNQGTCQEDHLHCDGDYVSGKCSGGVTRRCCLPSGDSDCLANQGTCQEDHLNCAGGYVSGMCSGVVTRRCCLPSGTSGSGGCSDVNIISRSQWGARAPTDYSEMNVPVSKFFVHHTAGAACHDVSSCSSQVRGIQNYHMNDRGWSDIGYSFLVGGDGNVYEGRGWTHVGAHTSGYNSVSFGASMIGNFMHQLPTSQALTAVKNLIACGIHLGKISPSYQLFGHRDAKSTDCPGDALYAHIQTWTHYSDDNP